MIIMTLTRFVYILLTLHEAGIHTQQCTLRDEGLREYPQVVVLDGDGLAHLDQVIPSRSTWSLLVY
jgi:hypothetical protein